MRKLLTLSSVAAAATMVLAAPTFAQAPQDSSFDPGELIITADGPNRPWSVQEPSVSAVPIPVDVVADDEIVVACLRLPTLADLSKERWNDVHRRYPGRRGQPIRRS